MPAATAGWEAGRLGGFPSTRYHPARDLSLAGPSISGNLLRDSDGLAGAVLYGARPSLVDVVDPRDTRPRLIDGLRMLRAKCDQNPRKMHGSIPL